jgi:hypothetical protein
MNKKVIVGLVCAIIYSSMILGRLSVERKHLQRGGFEKAVVGSTWDPRNYDKIQKSIRQRESDAFRNQLVRGNSKGFAFPGLKAAQISWTWLNLLQSVHYESSYENDFSWMFSKIYFIVSHAHPKEVMFARGLAPFYLVIGKDHPGANIVIEEILKRNSSEYQIFFWGGFHALYNLYNRKMASWMYRQGALRPGAPAYLAPLSYKLEYGEDTVSSEELLNQVLEKEADPKIVELIKQTSLKALEKKKNPK